MDFAAANATEALKTIGPFAAAAAAVAIAIRNIVRDRLKQPNLSLSSDPEDPFDYMTGFRAGRAESHWIRVRFQNKPRRRSAHEVEVLVVRLRELGSTASPIRSAASP